jgi:hypothetical protein
MVSLTQLVRQARNFNLHQPGETSAFRNNSLANAAKWLDIGKSRFVCKSVFPRLSISVRVTDGDTHLGSRATPVRIPALSTKSLASGVTGAAYARLRDGTPFVRYWKTAAPAGTVPGMQRLRHIQCSNRTPFEFRFQDAMRTE